MRRSIVGIWAACGFACAIWLSAVAPAAAQNAAQDGGDASLAIIEQQLEAMAADDWMQAYSYAHPNIQQIYPSAEAFAAMVQTGYAMVWRPLETEYLGGTLRADGAWVHRLRFVEQDGDIYLADYLLSVVDSEWRVAGVWIVAEPGPAA